MTGLQEHPGTGRRLDHQPTTQLPFEELARAVGVTNVHVIDPTKEKEKFERLLFESLQKSETTLIIARRPCLLSAKKLRAYQPPGATNAPAE
jgi:indolepyruvate ferredoxin oxidoreductase, alpha subunit